MSDPLSTVAASPTRGVEMRVLVATARTQGDGPGDYCHTVEGELVQFPMMECCNSAQCGCGRGFAGLASHRATTTALVADRPEIDRAELRQALADSVERGGWSGMFTD